MLGVMLDEWKLRTANAQRWSSSRYPRKDARATEELRRKTTVATHSQSKVTSSKQKWTAGSRQTMFSRQQADNIQQAARYHEHSIMRYS